MADRWPQYWPQPGPIGPTREEPGAGPPLSVPPVDQTAAPRIPPYVGNVGYTASNSVTSLAFGANANAGDGLVIFVTQGSANTVSASDGASVYHTWATSVATGGFLYLIWCESLQKTNPTITLTLGGSTGIIVTWAQIVGANSGFFIDGPPASATATSTLTPLIRTTSPNDLILCGVGAGAIASATFSAGFSHTALLALPQWSIRAAMGWSSAPAANYSAGPTVTVGGSTGGITVAIRTQPQTVSQINIAPPATIPATVTLGPGFPSRLPPFPYAPPVAVTTVSGVTSYFAAYPDLFDFTLSAQFQRAAPGFQGPTVNHFTVPPQLVDTTLQAVYSFPLIYRQGPVLPLITAAPPLVDLTLQASYSQPLIYRQGPVPPLTVGAPQPIDLTLSASYSMPLIYRQGPVPPLTIAAPQPIDLTLSANLTPTARTPPLPTGILGAFIYSYPQWIDLTLEATYSQPLIFRQGPVPPLTIAAPERIDLTLKPLFTFSAPAAVIAPSGPPPRLIFIMP